MQRRVQFAIMVVTTAVVLLFAIPLGFVLERLLAERAVFSLEHRADLAARSLDLIDTTDKPDASEFPIGPERFALYSPAGQLRIGFGPKSIDANAASNASVGRKRTFEREENLVTILPVMSGEETLGFLRAERSLNTIDATSNKALALLAAGVIFVLGIGWVMARRLAKSISKSTTMLRDAALRLGQGDFTTVVPKVNIEELDQVGSAISATAQQLDALVAREQAFSADVSHQLRTPLAGLRTAIETEVAFPRENRNLVLTDALVDVGRLEQTVADLLNLAREGQRLEGVVDVASVVTATTQQWSRQFEKMQRTLTLRCPPGPLHALGKESFLRQALDALVDNASKHGVGETVIRVLIADDSLSIVVSDEGKTASMNSESKTGLGLALTRRLVQAQGGRFVIVNEPQLEFRIVLVPVSKWPAKKQFRDSFE
jgi:signal transduction histidine kinase